MRFIFILILGYTLSYAQTFAMNGVSISSNTRGISTTSRENTILKVVNSKQMGFAYNALMVFIDGTLIEPRGRMRGHLILLSAKVIHDNEFLKLFVHELGHYIDTYILIPKGGNDVSNDFYTISWKSPNIKRPTEPLSSFVTGYAMHNQYEDFAESFVFYVFHNRIFEDRAMSNDSLRRKYLFFRRNVFSGGAFTDTDFTDGKIPPYTWDSTKIPISLQKYLHSLRD